MKPSRSREQRSETIEQSRAQFQTLIERVVGAIAAAGNCGKIVEAMRAASSEASRMSELQGKTAVGALWNGRATLLYVLAEDVEKEA